MRRTVNLMLTLACAATIGLAGSAVALEPPTVDEIREKINEFMTWYRSAGSEARDPQKRAEEFEAIFADVDFSEMTFEGIRMIQNYASMSPSIQEKVNNRLADLKDEPGATGAAASSVLILLKLDEGNEAIKQALADTINHPGFADAVKQGLVVDTFAMLGRLPDEVVTDLKDEILSLRVYIDDMPDEMLVQSGVSYILAVNKLGDEVDKDVREELRGKIRDRLLAAAEGADSRMAESYQRQADFLQGASARGELIGHEAPRIRLTWTNSTQRQPTFTTLSDLKGKVVVLDFWATWCGPCIASFPNIRELQERYNGYDVAIVGVTSLQGRHYPMPQPGQPRPSPIDTKDNPDLEYKLMGEYMEENDINWIIAFSEENVFNSDFGVRGIPHMSIIDAAGKVRYNGLHPASTTLAEKSKKIDALLEEAGLPVPAPLPDEKPGDQDSNTGDGGN